MTEYVVGFAFDSTRQAVALIEKRTPKWQAGKLNGIGGHVEAGESLLGAQIREFEEETGVHIADWQQYAILEP